MCVDWRFIFWDVQLHKLVNSCWHSGTVSCLHLQGSSSWDPSWCWTSKCRQEAPPKCFYISTSWESIISQRTRTNNTTVNCDNPKTRMCWLYLHDTFKLRCASMSHWLDHHKLTTLGHTTKAKICGYQPHIYNIFVLIVLCKPINFVYWTSHLPNNSTSSHILQYSNHLHVLCLHSKTTFVWLVSFQKPWFRWF